MKQEQIKRMEDAIAADYTNMVGMVIVKDGETVYENYYNGCTAESRIHVFSVTKSVVSILIGIAIDKGLIKSIDDKVLDYYPDLSISDLLIHYNICHLSIPILQTCIRNMPQL